MNGAFGKNITAKFEKKTYTDNTNVCIFVCSEINEKLKILVR